MKIEFNSIEPGEYVRIKDAEGVEREGVFTYLNWHTAGVGVAVFAEVDPTGVADIPVRRLSRRDIVSIERIARGSEAEVFFRGASLEEAIMTVLGTSSLHDVVDPPDGIDKLVTDIAQECREFFIAALNYPDRVETVTEKAIGAFWQVVAAEFNDLRSGDMPADAVDTFEQQAVEAVTTWVKANG